VRHLLAIAALAAAPALARAADLVGPETCKACHPAAYESWRNGPHARARDSLTAFVVRCTSIFWCCSLSTKRSRRVRLGPAANT
jgi:hypothetical protein